MKFFFKIFLYTLAFLLLYNNHCYANKYIRQTDSLTLVDFYNSTGGENWDWNSHWFDRSIDQWMGLGIDSIVINQVDTMYIVKILSFPMINMNGTLPDLNLTDLEVLHIGDNNLTGGLPKIYSKKVKIIEIYRNNLGGTIPDYSFPALEKIILDSLNLTGPMPFFHSYKLKYIDLSRNNFYGEIPKLPYNSLDTLNLSFNEFSGSLSEVYLPALEKLLISYNYFTSIPDLNRSPKLKYIEAKHNKLTFKYLEQVAKIKVAYYDEQDTVLPVIQTNIGGEVALAVWADGTANIYQWFKDTAPIPDAVDSIYKAKSSGSYYCKVTNSIAVKAILYSDTADIIINSVEDKTGNSLFNDVEAYYSPDRQAFIIKTADGIPSIDGITVFDIYGRPVARKDCFVPDGTEMDIPAEYLNNGVYFIQFDFGNKQFIKKVIICE